MSSLHIKNPTDTLISLAAKLRAAGFEIKDVNSEQDILEAVGSMITLISAYAKMKKKLRPGADHLEWDYEEQVPPCGPKHHTFRSTPLNPEQVSSCGH